MCSLCLSTDLLLCMLGARAEEEEAHSAAGMGCVAEREEWSWPWSLQAMGSVFPGRGTRGRSGLCFNLSKNSLKFLSSLLHKEEASTTKLAKKVHVGSSDPVRKDML